MRLSANEPESKTIKRKIGSTEYEVTIYFSRTSRETISDKIKRLIKNDMNINRKAVQDK